MPSGPTKYTETIPITPETMEQLKFLKMKYDGYAGHRILETIVAKEVEDYKKSGDYRAKCKKLKIPMEE